jgi:hypothetical protein
MSRSRLNDTSDALSTELCRSGVFRSKALLLGFPGRLSGDGYMVSFDDSDSRRGKGGSTGELESVETVCAMGGVGVASVAGGELVTSRNDCISWVWSGVGCRLVLRGTGAAFFTTFFR